MEHHTKQKNICLAVLPLQNLSDERDTEIFCAGLVMDIITDLSRFRSFEIISYDSIVKLHDKSAAGSSLLTDLALDYLVKGLVRMQQKKFLFNIQLVNVRKNKLVWAEKFSGTLDELFQIQEEIVKKIVVSLQHFVDQDLLSEIRKKPATNLNAYECWLRGMQELKKGTIEADEQARTFFREAIEIDPDFARAYTGMSLTYFNEWSCQIWDRWEVSQKGAFEWARKALDLNEMDHVSTTILGKLYLFNGEYEKAEHFLRRSIRLNPNDAENLIQIAYGLAYLGYPDEAHQLYEKANKLNPAGDDACFACGTFIHFEMGNFDEAISLGEKHQLGKGWIDFPAYLAAAYYRMGNLEKVDYLWQEYLKQFSKKINRGEKADTKTALRWMMDVNPYQGKTRLQPFWDYMEREYADEEPPERSTRFATPAADNSMIREGNQWIISFEGKQVRIGDLKGIRDIVSLFSRPNEPVHCTELAGNPLMESGQEIIDKKAKKDYRNRILELQQRIEEAESLSQSGQLASLREEYDQLIEHLSRSTGLGGNTRKVSGSVEKARAAVTWRIRNAIKKIEESHPALGRHLNLSIKTGTFCRYAPEKDIHWIL